MGQKPLLIYDGNCQFCLFWVGVWRQITQGKVDYQASFEADQKSIKLIDGEKTYLAAEAAFRALAYNNLFRLLIILYETLPGFKEISEFIYSWVAKNRRLLSRIASFSSQKIFFVLLSLSYFFAFSSYGVQIKGLIGANGISPAEHLFEQVFLLYGSQSYFLMPSIFWINHGDLLLQGSCILGSIISLVLLYFSIITKPESAKPNNKIKAACLISLYILYLSLASATRNFLNFQWDVLILETGFLSIFLALFPDSKTVIFLFRVLLFKLMFSSGIVKLASGDQAWGNLTALNHHYETQPLANPLSWYVHQLPEFVHKLSTLAMFFIELALPFLIFLNKELRILGIAGLIGLQVLIILTGNYCFFNLVSIAICIVAAGDGLKRTGTLHIARRITLASLAFFLGLGSFYYTVRTLSLVPETIFNPVRPIIDTMTSYRITSAYGLFAIMTTIRREIVIEGSNDQKEWFEYEFKHKPGNLYSSPTQIAPFQPRLDWQMWFAALGDYKRNSWIISLMSKLLEGEPEVIKLIKKNPFRGSSYEKKDSKTGEAITITDAPKYMRAVLYKYEFTNIPERLKTGRYWKREYQGTYTPQLNLR